MCDRRTSEPPNSSRKKEMLYQQPSNSHTHIGAHIIRMWCSPNFLCPCPPQKCPHNYAGKCTQFAFNYGWRCVAYFRIGFAGKCGKWAKSFRAGNSNVFSGSQSRLWVFEFPSGKHTHADDATKPHRPLPPFNLYARCVSWLRYWHL